MYGKFNFTVLLHHHTSFYKPPPPKMGMAAMAGKLNGAKTQQKTVGKLPWTCQLDTRPSKSTTKQGDHRWEQRPLMA